MEDNNKNKSELDKVNEQSFKSIILEAIELVTKKLHAGLIEMDIGILRVLNVLAFLLIWWGANKFFSVGLTLVADYGIFTVQMVLTVAAVFALFYIVSRPSIYLMHILVEKAKQEKGKEEVDIYKKSSLSTVGKVGRIICSVIGVITLVVGIISGFVTYGVNSLVLLYLTSCCFWLGAELFFSGVESTFKTIEEISRDEIKSDEENVK